MKTQRFCRPRWSAHGHPGWGMRASRYEAGNGARTTGGTVQRRRRHRYSGSGAAGVDIITDGEVRRLDGYVDSYYSIIEACALFHPPGRRGPGGTSRHATRPWADQAPSGLGIVQEFAYLRAHTTRATKPPVLGR
jgi:hypothetical protein